MYLQLAASLVAASAVPAFALPATTPNTKSAFVVNQEPAGQVLFLCFDRVSRGQYSVRVPCLRPTRYRTPLQLKQANKKGHAEAIPPREKVVESDDHMIERMRETIESELGKWTRFVPYFGVIGAEIVEVSCSCCLVTYLLSKPFGTNNPTQVPISPSLLCTKPTADRHR